jgi:hypothetical protein
MMSTITLINVGIITTVTSMAMVTIITTTSTMRRRRAWQRVIGADMETGRGRPVQ